MKSYGRRISVIDLGDNRLILEGLNNEEDRTFEEGNKRWWE